MAADLGLVAHAAQAHADELAAGRLRDRLAERGLAHAGRPDEAQDRRLQPVDALLHREVLDDALLDLLEAVMVGVEDLHRGGEVLADLALLPPRQREQRVDEVAHDRRLGRHRRHHLELLELAERLRLGLLRHPGGLDLLLHLVEVGVLVALAEFLLDRLDLLVQVVLALALLHLPLDAAADALLDLQDVDLAFEQPEQVLEALGDGAHLEDLLLLLELQRQVRGDRVGEAAAVVDPGHRGQDLGRDLLVELDVLVELREQRAAHRLDLVRLAGVAGQRRRLRRTGTRLRRRRGRPTSGARPRPAPSPCRRAASASAAPWRRCRSDRGPRRPGSSLAADFCATSRMCLPESIATSSALIDFGRPTNSGITMCGNTTTSRSGSSGSDVTSGEGARSVAMRAS